MRDYFREPSPPVLLATPNSGKEISMSESEKTEVVAAPVTTDASQAKDRVETTESGATE
jgi:hypothetical protein